MTNPTCTNPYNQILLQRRQDLQGAQRVPLAPGRPASGSQGQPTSKQLRSQLLTAPINAFTAGDNALIPTLSGKKLIYEIVLWNVAAQTLALYQGPSASGILLLRLTSFPALTGFTLGFDGSFAQPHFEIDAGQQFVLNLANSTQVDGFIRFSIGNGSN